MQAHQHHWNGSLPKTRHLCCRVKIEHKIRPGKFASPLENIQLEIKHRYRSVNPQRIYFLTSLQIDLRSKSSPTNRLWHPILSKNLVTSPIILCNVERHISQIRVHSVTPANPTCSRNTVANSLQAAKKNKSKRSP